MSMLQLFTQTVKMTKNSNKREWRSHCTCFKAFLLCFCEGEISLLVGTEGEEHRGCGEDGCDCSLEGTTKKRMKQMSRNTLPEGGVQPSAHHAFVLMKLKPTWRTKLKTALPGKNISVKRTLQKWYYSIFTHKKQFSYHSVPFINDALVCISQCFSWQWLVTPKDICATEFNLCIMRKWSGVAPRKYGFLF